MHYKKFALIWITFVYLLFTSNLFAETQKCPDDATEIGCDVGIHLTGYLNLKNPYKIKIIDNYAYILSQEGFNIIDISNPNSPIMVGSITNLKDLKDLEILDSKVFLANGKDGIAIIDISNPHTPILIKDKILYHQNITSIELKGSYAYITDYKSGLKIVNISDLFLNKSVSIVGAIDTGGYSTNLKVIDKYAYLLNEYGALDIIDISDPKSLTLRSSIEMTAHSYPTDIEIVNNYAYVTHWKGLRIIDISNIDSPIVKKDIETRNNGFYKIKVINSTAYIATSTGLEIIDISNPIDPIVKGYYGTEIEDFSLLGKYAYLVGSNGLEILDISNPTSQQLKDLVNKESSLIYEDITYIKENYAYTKSKEILDVSNPSTPQVIAKLKEVPNVVANSYGYISYYNSSNIKIIDLRDPKNPKEVNNTVNIEGLNIRAAKGSFLYADDYENNLYILDIKNPSSPVIISVFKDINFHIRGIKVKGNYIYIETYKNLKIIDISDPKSPKLQSSLTLTEADSSYYNTHIEISNSYYYSIRNNKLIIIDIHDKNSPKLINEFKVKGIEPNFAIKNNFLYLPSITLKILNITNPKNIIIEKEIKNINIKKAHIVNNYLYLSGFNSISVFDITIPTSPILKTLLGTLDKLKDIKIKPLLAYVEDYYGNIQKINIANFSNLSLEYEQITGEILDLDNVEIIENYAYIKDIYSSQHKRTMEIYDISKISEPIYKGKIKLPVIDYIKIVNSYMYVIDEDKGFVIIDISDLSSPIQKGQIDIEGGIDDIEIIGSYAYVVNSENGLTIIDISNVSAPKKISSIKTNYAIGLDVKGKYVYIADGQTGLNIIDISDINNPILKSKEKNVGASYDVKIVGKYAYMAGGNNGFRILDITNHSKPKVKISTSITGSKINIRDNYLYLSKSKGFYLDDNSGFKIIDISTPLQPKLLYSNALVDKVFLSKEHLYLLMKAMSYHYPDLQAYKISDIKKFYSKIKNYYKTHSIGLTSINTDIQNPTILYKNSGHNVKFFYVNSTGFIQNKTNWQIKIDGKVIDTSTKQEFTTSFDYSNFTLGEHTLEIFLLDENNKVIDKKTIILNIKEYSSYNIDKIIIIDEYQNEYKADSVPTNEPLIVVADVNSSNTDDINFKWFINGEKVKEALGKDGGEYLDYTFTEPSTTITLTISKENDGEVTKELKVITQLNSLENLRAIGENRKIVVINGYFEEGMDRTGNYYTPTSKKLAIYDTENNSIIANITLSNTNKIKIYTNQIIGTDENAYITFADNKLPLFRGKFKIEDGVLHNLLIAESLNEEKLNKVLDVDKYCEDVTDYETLVDNNKQQQCKELIDNTKLDREVVSFISKNTPAVTDATLLVGIDANAIGLSPSLMATPFLWSGELDLVKKEFKLTALASAASMFNLKGNDFSLLIDKTTPAAKKALLSSAKKLGRIPFVYTLKLDGSAKTEIGKSKLSIKALTLEFTDSKSLVLETKVVKLSDNEQYRKNTATIKKAKAYLSFNKSLKTNIGFDINNAKLEEENGEYKLKSYDGGANFSIPDIPLGKGRSIKNISAGIYFVGRSSIYDTDDWPITFIDKHSPTKSKFYIYLKGHGEYIKESAPKKTGINDAWYTGDDYKNTLTVDFKVIPFPVAHYDNGLLLSADLGYKTDGTSNILNAKGLKLKELEGKYRYDTNLDDFLWKASAEIEAVKYRGRGSIYWNWGDNLAIGATIKNFGLTITNNKRFIFGDGCMLGGVITPTFMSLAECPKLDNSCSSKLDISKKALVTNGYIFGMKAQPHYESRFSAAYPWENPFPYLEANAEIGFKVLMDEKVKKGNANAVQFKSPKLTANLAGSGSLSMKIPKSKSKIFPFPTKDIKLVELCVGMSPFDVQHYYEEGLFVKTEKVENVKGLFGFYGKASLTGKEAIVFYSFFPFKIKDVDKEQTWLYGTNFKIEVKDTVSKNNKQYRQITKAPNTEFSILQNQDGENVIEKLIIPEDNDGPLILIKGVKDVEITTPSGDIVSSKNVDNFDGINIEHSTDSITIGLNKPESGTWYFKFKNNNYDFLVYSENKAPTANASILTTDIEYGTNFLVNLDYKDIDNKKGYIKIVATNKQGKEYILYDNNITVPYNKSIELSTPDIGEFNLKLYITDGLRAYQEISLGTINITEPSNYITDLQLTSGKNNLVSEWKSLNIVESFDVILTNNTTSITNIYDVSLPNFSQENLQDGEYNLTIKARYKGNIVDTLTKKFSINKEQICLDLENLTINEEFNNGYLLNFETKDASYYIIDIQSYTDKFKHLVKKQIQGKIDISSFVGEGIKVTIQAFNKCDKGISKTKEFLVSNKIDNDNDSLYDDWEEKYFGNLEQSTNDDFDSDNVTNLQEQKNYTSPTNGDTDSDKISDYDDPNPYLKIDNNQNRIPDDWEAFYNVGNLLEDYDGDGVSSYDEYFLGTNPKVKDNNLINNINNKAPVIKTDKDNFKTLTVIVNNSLSINASDSFDTDGDTLTYSWIINNKKISSSNTIDITFKKPGINYIKLILSDQNNHTTIKTWTVLVTKQAYEYNYIKTGKKDIELYYNGVKFTFSKNFGIGELFTIDIPIKDLPIIPKDYKILNQSGKLFIFNGKTKLDNNIHIDHVSNDKLLRYSYEDNQWYISAHEGQSIDTNIIGLFVLANKKLNDTTNNVKSSGGGCFIATAAYGSYLQKDVQILRNFRDKYLLTNNLGRNFVRTYYKYSPPIANYIANHKYIRLLVRGILTIIINIFKYPFLFILLLALFIFTRKIIFSTRDRY